MLGYACSNNNAENDRTWYVTQNSMKVSLRAYVIHTMHSEHGRRNGGQGGPWSPDFKLIFFF